MKYADGTNIEPGDVVSIDARYSGRVVASMDTQEYLPGQEHWEYLGNGIIVDTEFGGMVHYTKEASDVLFLVRRGSA